MHYKVLFCFPAHWLKEVPCNTIMLEIRKVIHIFFLNTTPFFLFFLFLALVALEKYLHLLKNNIKYNTENHR